MNIFITGVTGFIGRHLAERFVTPEYQVFGLARSINKFKKANLNCQMIKGDLSNFEEIDQQVNIDVIIHTAGVVHAHDVNDFYKNNFEDGKIFFNKMAKLYSHKKIKFIYFSSLTAAGPSKKGELLTEEMIPNPVDDYGRSKLLLENYIRENAPELWEVIIIRPPIVIGPYDLAMLDIFKMVKSKIVFIPGTNGKEKEYSFIFVKDIVNFIEIVLKSTLKKSFQIYYLSYPKITNFLELHLLVKDHLKINKVSFITIPNFLLNFISKTLSFLVASLHFKFLHKVRLTKDKYLEIREDSFCSSGLKATSDFNFSYKYDLNEAIKITTEDYINSKLL